MTPYYEHAGKYGNIDSCLVEKTTTDSLTLDASRPAILSSKLKPLHTGRRSLLDKKRHGRQSASECLSGRNGPMLGAMCASRLQRVRGNGSWSTSLSWKEFLAVRSSQGRSFITSTEIGQTMTNRICIFAGTMPSICGLKSRSKGYSER